MVWVKYKSLHNRKETDTDLFQCHLYLSTLISPRKRRINLVNSAPLKFSKIYSLPEVQTSASRTNMRAREGMPKPERPRKPSQLAEYFAQRLSDSNQFALPYARRVRIYQAVSE